MFRKEDLNNVVRDKDELDRALEQQNLDHERKEIEKRMNKSKHQGDVLKQVNEKDRGRRKGYQETMFEQRAMKLAEIDYKKKIQTEEERNKQLLDQLRAQRPY